MDYNKLLTLALEAGEIMLTSGAETHRVEDTMLRILSTQGNCMQEAIVLTTGLFVSMHPDGSVPLSKVKRIPIRAVNLEKITRVNSMSRNFVSGYITLEEALTELETIRHMPSFSLPLLILAYGFGSAFFTPLFGGTFYDCIGAFFTGLLLGGFMLFLGRHKVSYFLSSLFGGIVITAFALLFFHFGIGNRYDTIIIGCLMPLVPGSTITNAIRDVMEGDFLCGASKVIEAVIIAVAIAGGVGVVLRIYSLL